MKKNRVLGIAYIALATLIFSTMEVMLKQVGGVFAPMQITVERFFIGGLCLLPLALHELKKRNIKFSWQNLRYFALTGLLCVPLSMVLYQLSISYGKAGVVAVLFSGNPIFVTILAALLLHEHIYWNNIMALALEIFGILAILNPFSANTQINPISVILVICSALLFALYSILGKRKTQKCGSIVVTCGSFLFGSMELFVLLLLGHFAPVISVYKTVGLSIFCDVPFFSGFSMQTIPFFLFICVVNSAAGYVFHMLAMETTNANTANLVFFFKPIIAPIIALIVLHEAITSNMVIGILFFLCGSLSGIIPTMLRTKKEEALQRA
ncbi:MAG: DMT family transporter [Evtepia sp.]